MTLLKHYRILFNREGAYLLVYNLRAKLAVGDIIAYACRINHCCDVKRVRSSPLTEGELFSELTKRCHVLSRAYKRHTVNVLHPDIPA